jgi:protein O-mannosyl-transferase
MTSSGKYSQSNENADDAFNPPLRSGFAGTTSSQPPVDAPGRRWNRPIIQGAVLLAVLGVVMATYWPSLSASALYMDDKFYLGAQETRNPSWTSVKTFFSEVLAPSVVKGYYQPLALTSIMSDFLDPAAANNLRPFHRTSLLLHMLNVALVVVLLFLLFGNWPISCLLGLLYGLHPLNADVVLWVAERKAVLSTCFALWSLVLYVRYVRHEDQTRHRDWKRYGASLFMYGCAVLSKPTAVPVAVLLLVLDYWPLMRLNWRALLEKVPFLIVCGLSAIVTVISQSRSFDEGRVEMMHGLSMPFVLAYSIGLYLFKTVWPAGIVYDYPFPRSFSLTNPEVLLCIMGMVAVIAAMAFSARRTRAWLASGLFFFIAISPTLGIVRFTSSIVSNRFMYLPMIGMLLPLAWVLNRLWNTGVGVLKVYGTRVVILGIGTVLVIGSACATRKYESQWHDTLTLLHYYLSQSPYDWKLHTRLGNEWIARGNNDSAIVEFTKAGCLNPGWAENHLNLGRALFTVGRFAEAKQAFTWALQQTPGDWRCHVLMGITLSRLNDFEGGLKELETASRLSPLAAEVHYHIAGILAQQGRLDEAAAEYRKTLHLDPQSWDAQRALDTIASHKPLKPKDLKRRPKTTS